MRYGLADVHGNEAVNPTGFPAQSSVLDEIALRTRVLRHYCIPEAQACRFCVRGDSDIYRITTAGPRYYLKVYRPPCGPAQIEAEARYVSALADAGVRVVRPVQRQDGSFATAIAALEGERSALLFEEAPPNEIEVAEEPLCREIGAAIAHLHRSTDALLSEFDLPVLDFAAVVNGTLPFAEEFLAAAEFRFLMDTATRLAAELDGRPREVPEFGLCHADLVTSNMRLDAGGKFTFLDFGAASHTWRAYDITVAELSVLRKCKDDDLQALSLLMDGYSSSLALSADWDQLFPYMRVLRWLSWIGGNAATLPLRLGTEPFEGDIFVTPVQRIRETLEELS